MRSTWFFFLLVGCVVAYGQSGIPHLPSSGASISAFVPERWVTIDTAFGDLNNDHRDDVALVLQCRDTVPGDTLGMGTTGPTAPPRTLAVLFGTTDGYTLALQNDHFILRGDEGGFFDSFEGVEVKDGTLLLRFYGGSISRFGRTYMFRYGHSDFELIAAEAVSYNSPTGEGVAHSLDLLSHRMTVHTGNVTEDDGANKTRQQDLPPWPLRTFDTFVRPFTWRIDAELTL